ncbi:TIGR02530 family flagellar biosynthesis protein [Butyrivibrio sp. NC3005]|uniref:TIGR02530 family flagellar biosynthesis protein n=1 Tax=Butyrivibrio sp. NC3005 TaxID=1280685 RepID=UPI002E8DED6D|nr:TIGR02530 family flagellar biosynthesis protein [Butyrivibrio sp. NC3005]
MNKLCPMTRKEGMMNGINKNFLSIDQIQNTYLKDAVAVTKEIEKQTASFAEILDIASSKNKEAEPLRFSKHATARLMDRNIEMTTDQINRLNQGKIEASEKGIKESLILVDQLAFIVNVKNNTVVTAMNNDDTDETKVFTNIDGAVIA